MFVSLALCAPETLGVWNTTYLLENASQSHCIVWHTTVSHTIAALVSLQSRRKTSCYLWNGTHVMCRRLRCNKPCIASLATVVCPCVQADAAPSDSKGVVSTKDAQGGVPKASKPFPFDLSIRGLWHTLVGALQRINQAIVEVQFCLLYHFQFVQSLTNRLRKLVSSSTSMSIRWRSRT